MTDNATPAHLEINDHYHPVNTTSLSELVTLLSSHKTAFKIYIRNYILEGHAVPQSDQKHLTFEQNKNLKERLDANEIRHSELHCHFTYKNDMFYFKTRGQLILQKIYLDLPSIIYKIQRRENFRVYFADHIQQKVEITTAPQLKARFNNISLTGCQLAIANTTIQEFQTQFKMDSNMKIKIQIFDFHKTIEGQIRFIQKSEKNDDVLIGLQFAELSVETTQELQAAILKVDRSNRQIND